MMPKTASRALGIVLTKRGKHRGRDIPMCGVPIERADEYLHRLIALGHRVAVCEQIEDPAEARKRGAQERGPARRRAPRHARHADRGFAPRRPAQQLSRRGRAGKALAEGSRFALGFLDISTGEFRIAECDRDGARGRDRAPRARRDHRVGRALWRRRTRAAVALAAGRDAARARRLRRRHRRAAARRLFRGRDRRRVRGAVAARDSPPPPPASPMWSAPRSASGRRCRRRPARLPARRSRSTPRRAPISN